MTIEYPTSRTDTLTGHALRAQLRAFVVLAVMLFTSQAVHASATGQFTSPKRRLDVDGTYSFWGRSASPQGGEVIKVAVSNAEFTDGFFDDFYDREYAIDEIFVDDEAKVVYFEFDADGRYRGLSYFFASGDNCGYCFDSSVRSTVRPVAGHLKGSIEFKRPGARIAFDINLDVPIPSKDRGEALPAGGGDPGHVYVAYHNALKAGDRKGVLAALDAHQRKRWDKYEKKGIDVMQGWWDHMHGSMESISVTGGYVRGDHAVVLFNGSSKTIDHLYGEALLRRENGVWVVRDELVRVGTRKPA